MTISLNMRALALADRMTGDPERYAAVVHRLPCGARLVDCGVEAPGGLEAGRLFAEICMGGLGTIMLGQQTVAGWWLPSLTVHTDHPALACLGAQYAGWAVSREPFFAMGSGPARALVRAERELFDELGYRDASRAAVLCLEGRALPDDAVARYVAERAGVEPGRLTMLIAPTASVVGGVQVAARVVETAVHKLHALGFDPRKVLGGLGSCPLPPVARSDSRAIGRTNDAILYAGQVALTVRADDSELERLVPQVPSETSRDYGAPFYEIFKRYGGDFYQVDPLLFSPAAISVTNLASGRTFQAGRVNVEVLRKSFLA
jgi:methenyltetrahydromethanopterin cyclohydrolase